MRHNIWEELKEKINGSTIWKATSVVKNFVRAFTAEMVNLMDKFADLAFKLGVKLHRIW